MQGLGGDCFFWVQGVEGRGGEGREGVWFLYGCCGLYRQGNVNNEFSGLATKHRLFL